MNARDFRIQIGIGEIALRWVTLGTRTRLQHVATAAAINLEHLAAWFRAVPCATTRTSRFAALAA